jgi:hypothetical protein
MTIKVLKAAAEMGSSSFFKNVESSYSHWVSIAASFVTSFSPTFVARNKAEHPPTLPFCPKSKIERATLTSS